MESFGTMMRGWRRRRRMSQQALSEAAEVSTRHLSFLETGKAKPSRQMVLVIGSALDVPLRDRNDLLEAAGYAPAYGARDLGSPGMQAVQQALDFVLDRFDPNPALAVDRAYTTLAMNKGAARLSAHFIDPDPDLARVANNAMHLLFHPKGLSRWIVNWERIGGLTLQRMQREARRDPRISGALLDAILAYPNVPEPRPWEGDEVLVPVHLARGGVELRFAVLLTTLGSALDVTAQDLTVETYFPMDEATERWLTG